MRTHIRIFLCTEKLLCRIRPTKKMRASEWNVSSNDLEYGKCKPSRLVVPAPEFKAILTMCNNLSRTEMDHFWSVRYMVWIEKWSKRERERERRVKEKNKKNVHSQMKCNYFRSRELFDSGRERDQSYNFDFAASFRVVYVNSEKCQLA